METKIVCTKNAPGAITGRARQSLFKNNKRISRDPRDLDTAVSVTDFEGKLPAFRCKEDLMNLPAVGPKPEFRIHERNPVLKSNGIAAFFRAVCQNVHHLRCPLLLDERTGKARKRAGTEFRIRSQRVDHFPENLPELNGRAIAITFEDFSGNVDNVPLPDQERFFGDFTRRNIAIRAEAVPAPVEIRLDVIHGDLRPFRGAHFRTGSIDGERHVGQA